MTTQAKLLVFRTQQLTILTPLMFVSRENQAAIVSYLGIADAHSFTEKVMWVKMFEVVQVHVSIIF